MKTLIIATLFVACIFARSESEEWTQFKQTYNKAYSKVEEAARFKIFSENLRTIRSHNEKKSYTVGVNAYTDLTHEEFKARFNLDKVMDIKEIENKRREAIPIKEEGVLPKKFSWVKEGAVTPVKDQGQCGSCWAFSSTGAMEGAYFVKTKKLVSLSEQQILDCAPVDTPCEGSTMEVAYAYFKSNKAELESDYPYMAEKESCNAKPSKGRVPTLKGYVFPDKNVKSVMYSLFTHGPQAIAIDASHDSFQHYRAGVYNEPECSPDELDHAVLLVGYGSEAGVDYWLIKNSWSEDWGMDGYVKIIKNSHNVCGVMTYVTSPIYNDV